MKYPIVIFSFAAVVCVLVFVVLYQYIYTDDTPQSAEPEQVFLSGTYLCLPLIDEATVATDCAVGVEADSGAYYALDLGLMSQDSPQLIEGDRIEAHGILTPILALSTDYWQKYPVEGIFSVTDSLAIIEEPLQSTIGTTTQLITDNAWVWQYTQLQTQEMMEAPQNEFVLTFFDDSSYTSTTDCNSLGGSYVVDQEGLTLEQPVSTKMFCEASMEGEYIQQLMLVHSYSIDGQQLNLHLNSDYGTMVFNAQ